MAKKKGCLKFFLLFTLVAVLLVLFVGIIGAVVYVGTLPSLEDLTPSPIAQTSKIYSIDGKLITEFHAGENREIISFQQMSPHIRDAIVSVEDKRFYDHQGVDYIRIIGALIADIRAGALVEGASTITQQYVKNVYLSPEKTWSRKTREAAIAIQLERHYTKDKIMEMYLNTIYFGTGTYGIEKASQVYFGVSASELTLDQAALLAGLVRSPENYSPFNDTQRAENRRNLVLTLMYEQELIDQQQYLEALTAPIEINEERTDGSIVSGRIAPYFIDHIKKELYDRKFTDYDVFKGGLRIYTTLDLEMQQKAEQAAKRVFSEEIGPSYSLISTDPSNGYIYALIGGKDYETSKFNIATQGKRQPGSVFKVMVLAEAMRQNISPNKTYNANGPITIEIPQGPPWQVNNYGGQKFDRDLSIGEATVYSVNVVYAQLMMEIGAENVQDLCEMMDIHDIGSNPAIALGGLETGITPLDISKIFSTFASGGVYREPVAILKITDARGNILYEHGNPSNTEKRIFEEVHAYQVTQILSRVIQEGTGRGANIGRPAAGKTGTTSDHRDAWFAGYTPELVTVVWMGYPDSTKPMEPIEGRTVVGGSYPSDIWREFMAAALEGVEPKQFPAPAGQLIDIEVCSESGLLPTPWCPHDLLAYQMFVSGQEPQNYCNIHNKIKVPNLIGRHIEEVREILERLHFEIMEISEHNDSYAENIVFDQNPEPEVIVESEQGKLPLITIKVSRGRETLEMPSLLGMDKERAEQIIQTYELSLANIIYDFNDQYPADKIFDQDPKPQEEISRQAPVTIYISQGSHPESVVPDIMNLPEQEALTKLETAGFRNLTIIREENTAAIGTVFAQVPGKDTVYNKESEIIIRISLGILVPDVTSLSKQQAINRLESKGLTVEVRPGEDVEGIVSSQNPAPGNYINYGSKVIIDIEEVSEPEQDNDEE